MKPCRRKLRKIALLTLDGLDPGETQELRTHLESCSGCAEYFHEMLNVRNRIRAVKVEPDFKASALFHRKVVTALRMQAVVPENFAAGLRQFLLSRSLGVPVSLVVLLVAAVLLLRPPQSPGPISESNLVEMADSHNQADLEPTVANYMAVADHSFEQFDDLLTQQANKPFEHLRVFTARGVADLDGSE